ncbi:MAG: TOBE domain-containing protein [Thermodesulfobacteriota bacterium]
MPEDEVGTPAVTGSRKDSTLPNPARIYSVPQDTAHLDSTQLAKLEQAFRVWSEASPGREVRASRKRILLIFLLIRYTGARLHEVLALDLATDLDSSRHVVRFGNTRVPERRSSRDVEISAGLIAEIRTVCDDSGFRETIGSSLKVDAGHVRRKCYELAMKCGFAQELGSPNAIRRARAIELMQSNVPLPVVQRILGHSTPNLTAKLMEFSPEDIRQVARHFIEKESARRTSARNTFFGKIAEIRRGDIQSQVELVTIGGDPLTTVITNHSLERLGLKVGSLVTAEVKAPWVMLLKASAAPLCSAENVFRGTVSRILRGTLTTEFLVHIHDGTELCAVVTEQSRRRLCIRESEPVWVMFNSFAVVLHVD